MKKNYEEYSEDNWYGKLKGIVKKTQKYNNYNIININEVTITEYEWNKIIELNDKHLERVAFILLVYQKINEIKNINMQFKTKKVILNGMVKDLKLLKWSVKNK